MKNIILIIFILMWNYSPSQTTQIKHINYTSIYDTIKLNPVEVTYWVTRQKVNCKTPLKRSNSYRTDPKLRKYTNLSKYYYKSGFDRGHSMPASISECQDRAIEKQSYYYSNISPQTRELNRGSWKHLEQLIQFYASKYDSIKVWTGSYGTIGKLKNKVNIPKYYWKVIYIKVTNSFAGYLFENSTNYRINGRNGETVSICKIRSITNFKFNP